MATKAGEKEARPVRAKARRATTWKEAAKATKATQWGDKNNQSSPGKWFSTIFMEGKKHMVCMLYQSRQYKDPSSCRYVHKCAVPKQDGAACGGSHPASQHFATSALCEVGLKRYRTPRFVCPRSLQVQDSPDSPTISPVARAMQSRSLDCSTLACRF